YARLHSGMLQPDLGRARDNLNEDRVGEFDLMLVRTLLSRWRMRPAAPSAFERLEGELARGWWGKRWMGDARQMLKEMDERWVGARQRAQMVAADKPTHTIEAVRGSGIRMMFP